MKKFKGLKISPGIASGHLCMIDAPRSVDHKKITHAAVQQELNRFRNALRQSEAELQTLYERVKKDVGPEEAAIFEVQQMMAKDPYFIKQIEHRIAVDLRNVGWAIEETLADACRTVQELNDSYFKERIADFRDFTNRLFNHISESERRSFFADHDRIVIAAENLLPSHTVSLPKERIVGFVTQHGGSTGHAAILARSLGVPLVSGIIELFNRAKIGDQVIVNGYHGEVVLKPTARQIGRLDQIKAIIAERHKERKKIARLVTRTKDGEKIGLFANISSLEDAKDAEKLGAQGVGLYRTELHFMDRTEHATEIEQYQDYKSIADYFYPKPVVIRTLDLGGDKFKGDKPWHKEPNPYLGCRAVRISLREPELFKNQIRAILRAGAAGNVKIMFPMITCIEELIQVKNMVQSAKRELSHANIPYDENMPLGIMVEVPSTAIDIQAYLPHVDFISVGTNDLVQYTLAVDRGNEMISNLYQPLNPSILYLLNHISEQARRFDKEASICGEIAGDGRYTDILLAMGYKQLSMSAPFLLHVKMRVRSIDLAETKQIWKTIQNLHSATEIDAFIEEHFGESLGGMML